MYSLALARTRHEQASIAVRADPNGLAFDAYGGQLFVADGQAGGIAVTPDGTAYVSRLGGDRAGAIVRIEPDGHVDELPGLSPLQWRVGVAYHAPGHVLYVTQFQNQLHATSDGSVAAIDLSDGHVTTVVRGLGKLVGVARVGGQLVVSDAKARIVYRVELKGGRAGAMHILAHGIDRPDSVCALGTHAVLVTTYDETTRIGAVRRIWLDGFVETLVTGAWEPGGIATNGDQAFVAIRRGARILVIDV